MSALKIVSTYWLAKDEMYSIRTPSYLISVKNNTELEKELIALLDKYCITIHGEKTLRERLIDEIEWYRDTYSDFGLEKIFCVPYKCLDIAIRFVQLIPDNCCLPRIYDFDDKSITLFWENENYLYKVIFSIDGISHSFHVIDYNDEIDCTAIPKEESRSLEIDGKINNEFLQYINCF